MIDTAEDRYLTPSQAARLLGLSSQRVRQLLDAGTLRAVRTPLGHLVERASVERLVTERRAVIYDNAAGFP